MASIKVGQKMTYERSFECDEEGNGKEQAENAKRKIFNDWKNKGYIVMPTVVKKSVEIVNADNFIGSNTRENRWVIEIEVLSVPQEKSQSR